MERQHQDPPTEQVDETYRQPSTAELWFLVRAIDQNHGLVRIIKTMLEPCLADLIMNQIKKATGHSQRCTRNKITSWMAELFCEVVLPHGVDAAGVKKVIGKMFDATRLGTQMSPYEGNGYFRTFGFRQPRRPTTGAYHELWWRAPPGTAPLRHWPDSRDCEVQGVAQLAFEQFRGFVRGKKDVRSKDVRNDIAGVFYMACCIVTHLRRNVPVMQALWMRPVENKAFIRRLLNMLLRVRVRVFGFLG